MRVALILALACLIASAIGAHYYFEARPTALSLSVFLHDNPNERAVWGEQNRSLGAALSAYEQMAMADNDDYEAIWKGIRTGILISGTGYTETGLPGVLRAFLTVDYPRIRPHVDPDGRRLRDTVREWQRLRMKSEQFHIKAGTALWLAARGAKEGHDRLKVFFKKGPFYREFFSYAVAERPHWRCVGPVVEHYLTGDDLAGRVEAGVALLEYNALYGVGKELLDRSLRDIRAAFREFKANLKPGLDLIEKGRAEVCVFGIALLAQRGYKEERRIIETMWENRLRYPEVAALLRVARMPAGLRDFPVRDTDGLRPGKTGFNVLPAQVREYFYRSLVLHYLAIREDAAKKEEAKSVYEFLDDGTLDDSGLISSSCFRALARFEPQRWQELAKTNFVYRLRLEARTPGDADLTFVGPSLLHSDPGYAGLAAAILRTDLLDASLLQD